MSATTLNIIDSLSIFAIFKVILFIALIVLCFGIALSEKSGALHLKSDLTWQSLQRYPSVLKLLIDLKYLSFFSLMAFNCVSRILDNFQNFFSML